MRTREQSDVQSDVAALRHPIFWAALVLLVLNDHVLKGAGVLPGWLTGKLSDFAGLIVAPVLGAALLRARTRQVRAISFVAIAGWFAAVKVSSGAAALSVAAAGLAGLSWHIVVDPTDLVALAVLPLAWHVAAHRGPLAPRAWMERLALGLGVAASIASPQPRPGWTTRAYLTNRSGSSIEVRVRWVDALVDCAAVRSRFAEILPRESFTAGTLFVLENDATLPLDRGLTDRTDPWDTRPMPTGHAGTCDVAMVSVDGQLETVVLWDGLTLDWIPEIDRQREATDGLTVQRDASGALALEPARGYVLAPPVDVREDDPDCRDYGSVSGFGWSGIPSSHGGRALLREVREGIDGCLSLVLVQDELESRAYLCIPAADFPFQSGNEVAIHSDSDELRLTRWIETDRGPWRVGELVVRRGGSTWREGPFELSVVQVDAACGGVHLECGGFRVPGAGGIALADGTRFVHPGQAVERDDGTRTARLRVGRSETMWVTRDACGSGRDTLGARLEALVVYGEDRR